MKQDLHLIMSKQNVLEFFKCNAILIKYFIRKKRKKIEICNGHFFQGLVKKEERVKKQFQSYLFPIL